MFCENIFFGQPISTNHIHNAFQRRDLHMCSCRCRCCRMEDIFRCSCTVLRGTSSSGIIDRRNNILYPIKTTRKTLIILLIISELDHYSIITSILIDWFPKSLFLLKKLRSCLYLPQLNRGKTRETQKN